MTLSTLAFPSTPVPLPANRSAKEQVALWAKPNAPAAVAAVADAEGRAALPRRAQGEPWSVESALATTAVAEVVALPAAGPSTTSSACVAATLAGPVT